MSGINNVKKYLIKKDGQILHPFDSRSASWNPFITVHQASDINQPIHHHVIFPNVTLNNKNHKGGNDAGVQ